MVNPILSGTVRFQEKPKLITALENRKTRPENLQQPESREE